MAIVVPLYQSTGSYQFGNLEITNPIWRLHSLLIDALNSQATLWIEIGDDNQANGVSWRLVYPLLTNVPLTAYPTQAQVMAAVFATPLGLARTEL